MRIAIIGAGISGCSQYLWLEKVGLLEDHSVTIYEARNSKNNTDNAETYNASLIGANIGLSPTGLHVLMRLDAELYNEILKTGHVIHTWRMSNARGWTLSNSPVGGEGETMVMIGRENCCNVLEKRVPSNVIVRKKVIHIELAAAGSGPRLVFEDGIKEESDLVIGCDGIWSRTRRAIFGAEGRKEYDYSPHYEGLVGVGGFVPSSKIASTPAGEMNVVLGANGFFGYGYSTSDPHDSSKAGDLATWWSTYSLDKCPDDWRHIDEDDVKRELQKRHSGWRNVAVQNIVREVEIDSLYPTFTTPLLPTWEKGGCVLVGDAAHALQPSSGQGASMALEDCESLAVLLQYHLQKDSERGHLTAAEQYSQLRRPRLEGVYKKAQQLAGMKQDMGFFQETLMYLFVWLFSRLKVMEHYQQKLNEYDVPTEVTRIVQQNRRC